MLSCEVPLTPDQGEARDWLLKELAKGEYGEIRGPIVGFVKNLIDDFFRLLSWKGQGAPPISLILAILAIIVIARRIIEPVPLSAIANAVTPVMPPMKPPMKPPIKLATNETRKIRPSVGQK